MLSPSNHEFEALISAVQRCTRCEMMGNCTRVLSWANGPPNSAIMFVGEAPGRLGADRTAVPFHGDKAGDNFEKLLALAGLSRRDVFITNAVLCNPRDEAGNNTAPPKSVLRNCSENLAAQITTVQPQLVVTLGSAALESTRLIEFHHFTLSNCVRTSNAWFGRKLIPLYHPGARAMIHRNFALQTADYYFVGEQARRLGKTRSKSNRTAKAQSPSWGLVMYVLASLQNCSLFRLHKTLYLIDLEALKRTGSPLTDFFYIRQKDGPYCVELGSKWFKAHEEQLALKFRDRKPWLTWIDGGLFGRPTLEAAWIDIVEDVLVSIRGLSDAQVKTRSYLTAPMKRSLREERLGFTQLNRPLL